MPLIKLADIAIPEDRVRKTIEPAEIAKLVESIHKVGLLHWPVLRLKDGKMTLVAGHRRLLACQQIFDLYDCGVRSGVMNWDKGLIGFVDFAELTSSEALEIEIEENLSRVDIPWQEQVKGIALLDQLRKKQDATHTQTATAEEIHADPATVSRAIRLAESLGDKDVARAANPHAAMRILNKKLETELTAALADTIEVSSDTLTLKQGDAVELMKGLPSGSFEILITDPPYGVGAGAYRGGATLTHHYADDGATVDVLMQSIAVEAYRVCADKAHAYVFCDIRNFMVLHGLFTAAGFEVWSFPYIWVKDAGHIPDANRGPRHMYECILFANKGLRAVNKTVPDVITVSSVSDKTHAAEKPVALYSALLSISAVPGDRLLDPFCGSGTIFEAGFTAGLDTTGFDSSPESIGLSKGRIARITSGGGIL